MVDIEAKHPMLQFTKEEVKEMLAQYNRTVDNVQVDIDCVKKWIESQPHLTQVPMDRLILSMLLKNKFSIEKVKTCFDYYYSVRGMVPELFENRYPTNPDNAIMRKISHTLTLPKLDNLNRVAFFILDETSHKFSAYSLLAKSFMDVEAFYYLDLHGTCEVVLDYSNSTFAFWTAFTPTIAKTFVTVLDKVYPHRLKATRFIGLPAFANLIVSAALSCLPEKITKHRITTHSDRLEMTKYYPKEQLPVEYGGSGPSFREMSKDFDDMVDSCTDYFKNLQNFKVDEKLRPEKLNNDEFLGYHGNFRKLEVD